MRTLRVLSLLSASLLAACCREPVSAPPTFAPAAPPSAIRFLHAAGTEVVDDAGHPVLLKGCNLGGWLLIEPWILGLENQSGLDTEKDIWDLMEKRFGREGKLDLIRTHRENFFTEADARRIAEAGMNCVRVPIWWRALSDPDYGGDLAYLDRCIAWLKKNGVYVIIDLHGAPGGQSKQGVIVGEKSDGDLWKNPELKARTIEWWATLAERYKDEPAVAGYDLLNEAFSAPYDDLMDLYDALYRRIRSIDPRHMIILEDGLLGFHRMPPPADRHWANVMYSYHFYPQSTDEGLKAAGATFPRFQRAAMSFGVPTLVGEYNTMFVDRGGADAFRRYVEVFGYYRWASTFWTYKKVEDNTDTLWGLYGYFVKRPWADLTRDSLDTIKAAFEGMRTENGGVNDLLLSALRAPSRCVDPAAAEGSARTVLTLRDAWVLRGKGGDIRVEWGMCPPNVGFWNSSDTVAWRVHVPSDGTYELGLNLANNADGNAVRVTIDGVQAADAKLPNTRDWRNYQDGALGSFRLTQGPHILEFGQADRNNSFINLRYAWLAPSSGTALLASAEQILLTPLNMLSPRAQSPIRVEWLNDPPNIGYWKSGERIAWNIVLDRAGRYQARVAYGTPNQGSTLRLQVDGRDAATVAPAASGDWQTYRNGDLGAVELPAGPHEISLIWETHSPEGAGNLQQLSLERTGDAGGAKP